MENISLQSIFFSCLINSSSQRLLEGKNRLLLLTSQNLLRKKETVKKKLGLQRGIETFFQLQYLVKYLRNAGSSIASKYLGLEYGLPYPLQSLKSDFIIDLTLLCSSLSMWLFGAVILGRSSFLYYFITQYYPKIYASAKKQQLVF